MACSKAKTSLSKLVKDLGVKIEKRSGAKLNFASEATAPVEEWIPESKMARTKAINLRTAAQTQELDGKTKLVKLQLFNPSFFLLEENEILCRVPECSATTPRLNAQHIKQDLFLCEVHRTKLADIVSEICEENSVLVDVANFKQDDFNGYTSLIGELEKAFTYLIRKPATLNMPQNPYFPNSSFMLAEVFLNARNFLTITHALLNSNCNNKGVVLPPWFVMLDRIMDHLKVRHVLYDLVRAFREVMEIIFSFFGIIYAWVPLGYSREQLGGVAGLVIGATLGAFAATVVIPVGAALGFIVGKLIGGAVRAWYGEQEAIDRQNETESFYPHLMHYHLRVDVPRQPLYHVPGNPWGDVVLDVC